MVKRLIPSTDNHSALHPVKWRSPKAIRKISELSTEKMHTTNDKRYKKGLNTEHCTYTPSITALHSTSTKSLWFNLSGLDPFPPESQQTTSAPNTCDASEWEHLNSQRYQINNLSETQFSTPSLWNLIIYSVTNLFRLVFVKLITTNLRFLELLSNICNYPPESCNYS